MSAKNDNQKPNHELAGTGRTFGSGQEGQQEKTGRDISRIDQQEGNLENGELGGNLSEDIDINRDAADGNKDE